PQHVRGWQDAAGPARSLAGARLSHRHHPLGLAARGDPGDAGRADGDPSRRQQPLARRPDGDVHRARGHRRHRGVLDARPGGFSMTMPRIGFVGLGAMGGAMARHLVKSGYSVTGYDVSAARAEAAALAGVTLAASPAEAAASANVVMSSLPHPAAVGEAYLGDNGVLSRVPSGATLIDLSTVDPDTWKEVARAAAARGLTCLDAPVSGGPGGGGGGQPG